MIRSTFFNVGHGEAIKIDILTENIPRIIIRDFGRASSAKETITSMSVESVINIATCCCFPLFSNPGGQLFPKIDAVLSHAHEDHLNGFKKLFDDGARKIFSHAFIPMLEMSNLDSHGGMLIKYALFFYRYFEPTNINARRARKWLVATLVMAGLSHKLRCVAANQQVSEWGRSRNKILWPMLESHDSHVLKRRFDNFLKKHGLSNQLFDKDAESLREILSPYYAFGEEGHEFGIDQVKKDIKAIYRIIDSPMSKEERAKIPRVSMYHFNCNVFQRAIDNHGLVFEIGPEGNQQLFLSDAHDSAVRKMLEINDICEKHYQIIKAGHHGNRGAQALCVKKITADEVVICCGPAQSNYNGPDIAYAGVSSRLTCTDWNNSSDKWKNKERYLVSSASCICR